MAYAGMMAIPQIKQGFLMIHPPWVNETLLQLHMDPAHGMAAADVAKAYVAAVEGSYQGTIIEPGRVGG